MQLYHIYNTKDIAIQRYVYTSTTVIFSLWSLQYIAHSAKILKLVRSIHTWRAYFQINNKKTVLQDSSKTKRGQRIL